MERIVLLAPTLEEARRAGRLLRTSPGRRPNLLSASVRGFLRSPRAGSLVALCPPTESVETAVGFLREVERRILWPAPGPDLLRAICGFLGAPDPPPGRRVSRSGGPMRSALLLEGVVSPERARAAAAAPLPRDWIVEAPGRVQLPASEVEELRASGVRWFALQPVRVVALVATPALARARRRWAGLLPSRTPVWILNPENRAPRPRRPSPR